MESLSLRRITREISLVLPQFQTGGKGQRSTRGKVKHLDITAHYPFGNHPASCTLRCVECKNVKLFTFTF